MAGTPSQNFIPIESIRDGIVTLKNGEYRLILITSSINLSLKSEDEQTAILLQFQNMLNSLEFPIQIFMQSRKLDIEPYLNLLRGREKEIKEDLLKIQTREYIEFISKFTSEASIMTKHFFIVIPYVAPVISSSSSLNNILPFNGTPKKNERAETSFEIARTQLMERESAVSQGLTRFGVRTAILSTEDAIELFYKEFNPGETIHPKLEAVQQK